MAPHLVFLLTDDLGYYNVGFQGNSEQDTPFLDSLASSGVQLTRHYAAAVCSPARAALLSGRLPYHVTQNNEVNDIRSSSGIDLRMTLLPEKLQDAGYLTSCVGKWHLGARNTSFLPASRGFDTHFGFLKGANDHWTQAMAQYRGSGSPPPDLWRNFTSAVGEDAKSYGTWLWLQEAERVIALANATDRKLFLYLAFQNPHAPFQAPSHLMDTDISHKARRTYTAMVTAIDRAVDNITVALRHHGLFNDSLIIFTSDNGGKTHGCVDKATNGCGNKYPLRGQKFTAFEGGVRTPTFIAGGYLPAHLHGRSWNGLVSIADWYATLCALANVTAEDQRSSQVPAIDSLNFWPQLVDVTASNRSEVGPFLQRTSIDITS